MDVKETIGGIAATVGAAVVGVGRRGHVGSGIVIEQDTVLTNAHNIHSAQITVTFSDGHTETGEIAGFDPDRDLAVAKVATAEVVPVAWSTSSGAELGDPVVALSNPGGRGLRVTVGYVSGLDRSFRGPRGRRISGSIEHTAPLLPGSSGGPIVNPAGGLLGINTNRLGEGFYLAIAADAELQAGVGDLRHGTAPKRRYIGITAVPDSVARRMRRAVGLPEVPGVLVRDIVAGGPAAEAGIGEGDLIIRIGSMEIADVDDLHAALDAAEPGTTITMTVLRGTEEHELTVTIATG